MEENINPLVTVSGKKSNRQDAVNIGLNFNAVKSYNTSDPKHSLEDWKSVGAPRLLLDHDLVPGGLARPVVAEDDPALAVGVLLEVGVGRGPVDSVGRRLGPEAVLTSVTGTEAGGRHLNVPGQGELE